jgi:pimeloyl-ACP methyl ester carboxylesterase
MEEQVHTRFRRVAALTAPLTMLLLAVPATATASPAVPPENLSLRQCQTVDIPVALAAGDPANLQVSGEYCVPFVPTSTIDVLVPGTTYNHMYWDWPVDPATYSYVDHTLLAGRATLAIDRLGTGASSHPASTEITDTVSAYAVHQVIQWARQQLGYSRVDLIGHSLGSIIASIVAGTYPGDVTRLVLTGDLNVDTSDHIAAQADFYPASQDPQFSGDGYDPGYLTTIPGTRAGLYYYNGDPSVIAYDEAHKDVVSSTEFGTGIAVPNMPPGPANPEDRITAPVLLIVGQEDFLLCEGTGAPDCADLTALRQLEQPYYADAASLTALSVPDTGHDLALNKTAGISFALIDAWLVTH